MKITPISFKCRINFLKPKNKNTYQNQPNINNPIKIFYAYPIFFQGGKSLSLKDTFETFNNLAQDGVNIAPPGILKMISNELDNNPETTKTLVDIHKQKYEKLNDCYDLETAKSLYPEFNGVLSDEDADCENCTPFQKIKNGEIEGLNKEESVSLQLLKLYWAQALSLNDLRQEFDIDLYYLMNEKLKIPMLNKRYAKILKLSDKDYNERYTNALAEKIKESKERAIQESDGEPVYIPRGPLSEEHKKHISEGLIKYYSENPDKIGNLSKRQKEYYENNPEQRERMQKVMSYAWNGNRHGLSVLKHLRKYFKKMNVELNKPEELSTQEATPEQKKTFKAFWQKNTWAKGEFSLAVKEGWNKIKKDAQKAAQVQAIKEPKVKEEIKPILRIIPQPIVDEIIEQMNAGKIPNLGVNPELDLSDYTGSKMTEQEFQKKLAEINSDKRNPYDDFDEFVSLCTLYSDDFSYIMALSMIAISNDLLIHKKYCSEILKDKNFYKELCAILASHRKPAFENKAYKPNDSIQGYIEMARYAKIKGHIEVFKYIEDMVNRTYKLLKEKDETPQGVKRLHDFIGIKE